MWKKSKIGILILSFSLLLADISSCSLALAKEAPVIMQEETETDGLKDVDEEKDESVQNRTEEPEKEEPVQNSTEEPENINASANEKEESEEVVETNTLDQLAEENKNALANDTYFIRSCLGNDKVFDICMNEKKDYIQLGISNKKATQKFKVVHDDKGYVTFINEQNGQV